MKLSDLIARTFRIKQAAEPVEPAPAEVKAAPEPKEERGGLEVVVQGWNSIRGDGRYVTPETALQLSAVWACVRVISETVASLPLILYKREERGKSRATDHPLYDLLHNQANPFMTAFEFRETMTAMQATWGNAYAQIIYNARGEIIELWPLRSDRMLENKIVNGSRLYLYQKPDGKTEWLSDDQVWHLRGLGGDGLTGYSPIALMRRAIALGQSAEEFGERFFDNDARPGIVLEHPGKLTDKSHKNLKDSWVEEHQGLEKSHSPAILEEGMKLHEIGIPPADAQFLELRKFQVADIARIFRVPPHLIGDLDKATFSNIEHQSLEFVVHTMRPWLVRWEQSIQSNLMLAKDRQQYFPEFLVDGLLRGDTESRYNAYNVGRNGGWLSANDIRVRENMDAIPGGDTYLVPLNMVPADESGQRSLEVQPIEKRSVQREERSKKSTAARQRIMLAQQPVILDAAERMIKRETRDIEAAAKKYFGKRDAGQFMIWMEEYYLEHANVLQPAYLATFMAYAELVAAAIEDEIDTAPISDIQALVKRFVQSFLMAFAQQQITGSLNRLKETISRAGVEGVNPETAILAEMEHWREVRPNEITLEQSVKLVNAVSKVLYSAAGIAYFWRTMGDTCPYCKRLDGRSVGKASFFLTEGESLDGDEDHEPMKISHNIGHPPAHKGCDCLISS